MDFNEVVAKRRTTRQFKNEPVGRETIERIVYLRETRIRQV